MDGGRKTEALEVCEMLGLGDPHHVRRESLEDAERILSSAKPGIQPVCPLSIEQLSGRDFDLSGELGGNRHRFHRAVRLESHTNDGDDPSRHFFGR